MDIITLQIFVHVRETLNFTVTADKVGRTQSAVSQQIAKLEDMLGVQLLKRGKKLQITQEGEIFYNYAKKILSLQLEAIHRFKQPELQGEVKFGLPEDFASVFLSNILQDFKALHPRIMVNIECDLSLNLLERFKGGEFDLVLVKTLMSQDIPHGVDIWTESLEWVGLNEYIDAEVISLVLSPEPCIYRAHALQSLERARLKWRIIFTSPSYAGITAAVKAGLGISVLPRNMIPPYLQPITDTSLPKLSETHICLLKNQADYVAVNSLEKFVIKTLV
jgi:DNA-binding transcriptional LysR family regulator